MTQSRSGPKQANVVYIAINLKASFGYMTEFKTRMDLGQTLSRMGPF